MASKVAIGVARVVLHLPESGSRKAKRQIVSGLLQRLRQELKVAAAEVGELDRWQLAELVVATVSGHGRQAGRVLAAALCYVGARNDGAPGPDLSAELVHLGTRFGRRPPGSRDACRSR